MKKTINKITALLLAALMCITYLPVLSLAAVSFPEGIEPQQAQAAIPKTEKILSVLMKQNPDTADLSGKLYGMLFSDSTITSLFSGVYSALSENTDALKMLGIDISPAAVGAALAAYPEISEVLISAETWEDALKKSADFKWGVTDKAQFSNAVSAMLSPLNNLLYTLLCGADYKVNSLIKITGANGYENAVMPVLSALCCKGIMSNSYFTSCAAADRSTMVKNLLQMVFSVIDGVLATPVASICNILPAAAYFMENDGLSNAVQTLISPLQIKIAGIISISGISDMIAGAGMLENSDSLTSMLEGIDLGSMLGTDADINLATIDLAAFSQCGSVQNGVFVADPAAAYVEILRWLINSVKENSGLLSSLLGENAQGGEMSELLTNVLNKPTDELVAMIIKLLTLQPDQNVLEYSWTWAPFTQGTIQYTPTLTVENYTKVLNEIDGTLNEFLLEFGDTGSLSTLLSVNIYSNTLVSTLVTSVYGALYTEETAGLLSAIGIDASPAGVANAVKDVCPSAANTLSAAKDWESVSASSLNWGFYNGSRNGFKNAVTAALTPFAPFLRLLLAEGSFNLMDIITIYGSNGYNTAVIPLLEALGCESSTIKTYEQYKSSAATQSVITDIIEPLLTLIDRVIEKPVNTLCGILPNIVYFINNNGIKTCVANLIYPVTKILETVGMSDMLPDEIKNMGDLDISSIIDNIISSDDMPIKLTKPDLSLVSSLGTPVTLESRSTYNGAYVQRTYITADSPAVLLTVLRYIFGALNSEENSNVLSGLLGGDAMAGDDMMSMYAGNITKELEGLTTDETIEWFYNLLFAETPKKDLSTDDDSVIPTIKYTPSEKDNSQTLLIIGIALPFIIIVGIIIFIAKHDRVAAAERKKNKKEKKNLKKVRRHGRKK